PQIDLVRLGRWIDVHVDEGIRSSELSTGHQRRKAWQASTHVNLELNREATCTEDGCGRHECNHTKSLSQM
ncbi:MAG: hypothetical protein VX691_08650, partial [Actinomycetota bacterium]|nr:hypothetical protein [Actinomycetota bacterium]